jgi:hypothetical protein
MAARQARGRVWQRTQAGTRVVGGGDGVREACAELAAATGGRACQPGSGAGVQGEGMSLSGRVVI